MWEFIGILAGVVVIITGVAKGIQKGIRWWRRRPLSSVAQAPPTVEVVQGQEVTIYNIRDINININNEGREQDEP